jgi:hypothetical protein
MSCFVVSSLLIGCAKRLAKMHCAAPNTRTAPRPRLPILASHIYPAFIGHSSHRALVFTLLCALFGRVFCIWLPLIGHNSTTLGQPSTSIARILAIATAHAGNTPGYCLC